MNDHIFTHQGYTLHYSVAGSPDAPPVLMIHGYDSSRYVWRTTFPALENDFFCVAIDLLGHGNSPIDPQGDYSIVAQGQRVLALADHLGLERFALIGHSMGGQIALCIAGLLAPERVSKLIDVAGVVTGKLMPGVSRTILASIKLLHGVPVLPPLIEAFFRYASPRFKLPARYQFSSWFYDFNALDFDWWRIDRELTNQPGSRHTWYRALIALETFDARPHLPQITAPTLIIFGTEDHVVPLNDGQLALEHIPHRQLNLMENCGHFPMYEQPESFTDKVRDFLLA